MPIENIAKLLSAIHAKVIRPMSFMEVCGGHTAAIHLLGIRSLLPSSVKLLSGPGCPVCVTPIGFIDTIIDLGKIPSVVIASYGDLLRIPGSKETLSHTRGTGSDVRIIYSVLEAIELARQNPSKKIIFPAIGFETTAPLTASAILSADIAGLNNFFVLCGHKIMPPVMSALMQDDIQLDGFIAPGHVSTITGSDMYEFIPREYNRAVVVSGFEAEDILKSIYMLIRQVSNHKPSVEIQYNRAVLKEGNIKARDIMNSVFETCDTDWRGFGIIPGSGLFLRQEYQRFDALKFFKISIPSSLEPIGCICGDVLRGISQPVHCKLFGKACTPGQPVGACMVSPEGACHANYVYREV